MVNTEAKKLSFISNEVRKLLIEVANMSKSAHVGSSLSCVDLLVSLYFYELNIDENNWEDRDIFILSKAHAALALYSVLKIKGLISEFELYGYMKDNGTLPGHLDRFSAKAIEVSAGSLGHGFNISLGIAHGFKLQKNTRRIFTLIGDGESQEGSIWEGAIFASKLGLDNVTAILDYNNLQGYGRPCEICNYEPVIDKWVAFGWEVLQVSGHDCEEIISAFQKPKDGKPRIIIARTIKGRGVSFMEDELKWHYYIVTDEIKKSALKELEK